MVNLGSRIEDARSRAAAARSSGGGTSVVSARSSALLLGAHQPEPEPGNREPRRTVDLNGFGVLDDGTTFAISVVDLSYDGCKIETDLVLLPGLTIKVSIVGTRGALPARVRWSKDRRAGLRFVTEDEQERRPTPRKEERCSLAARISLRRVGRQHYQARLFDIAPTGCKVEFIERPRPGEMLWAKFDHLDALEAKVCWVDGFYGGLEFVRPIYPAVFELLLVRLKAS